MIHQGVPEDFVEFHGDLWQFGQSEEDAAEDGRGGFHLLTPIQQSLVSGFSGFVPSGQFCVLGLIICYTRKADAFIITQLQIMP